MQHIDFLLSFLIYLITGINIIETYSQFYEDRNLEFIIKSVFGKDPNNEKGFYIDIGCNKPITYNNTYYFYLRGWKGINIDGNLFLINKFKKIRNRDINIHSLISDEEKEVIFHISKVDELSSMEDSFIRSHNESYRKEDQIKMKTKLLTKVLDEHIKDKIEIDFMSIDVEGHDLNVLMSLDFKQYKIKCIIVEMRGFSLENKNNEIYSFLSTKGYILHSFSAINGYFILKESIN